MSSLVERWHCGILGGQLEIWKYVLPQFGNLERYYDVRFLSNGNNDFYTIMGKVTDEQDIFIAVQFLKVVAVSVNRMYNLVLKSRDGIG